MTETDNNNSYKDMSLFNDIENDTLRARNRGVVMGNISMDGVTTDGKLTAKASKDILEYFKRIPEAERRYTLQFYLDYLKQEGFTAVPAYVS